MLIIYFIEILCLMTTFYFTLPTVFWFLDSSFIKWKVTSSIKCKQNNLLCLICIAVEHNVNWMISKWILSDISFIISWEDPVYHPNFLIPKTLWYCLAPLCLLSRGGISWLYTHISWILTLRSVDIGLETENWSSCTEIWYSLLLSTIFNLMILF